MDIHKGNFFEKFQYLQQCIKSSNFIAIDTEFTGLLTVKSSERSLFDSMAMVYEKERNNLQEVSICQIGVSVFKSAMDENAYAVDTFNFYIRPHSILFLDEIIKCQISSLEFLNRSNFDFKMWLVDGIPCLNDEQEEEVRKAYDNILNGNSPRYMPYEVIDQITIVRNWLSESLVEDDELELPLVSDSEILLFISHIISLGLNVLPVYRNEKLFVRIKENISEEEIKVVARTILESIISKLKGFCKVFQLVVESKVPVIVHNGLIDIMLLYKQFFRSLPKSFSEFQNVVHSVLPMIYDTKRLGAILGPMLRESESSVHILNENFLRSTSLRQVRKDLEGEVIVLHRPSIWHNSNTSKYSDGVPHYHEAGYDAFCAGYCFAQLSHIYAMHKSGKEYNQRPISPRELTHALKQWANEIPVQRAGIRYMKLDSENCEVSKYNWLVIEQRNPLKEINIDLVTAALQSFGTVDVMRRNKRSLFLATPRNSVSQDIIRIFASDKQFKISKYSALKHSKVARSLLWSCAILSTSLSSWFLFQSWSSFFKK